MMLHLAGSRWAGVYWGAGGLLGASTGDVTQRHAAVRRVALYAGGRCCGRGVGAGEETLYRADRVGVGDQGRYRGGGALSRRLR